MRGPATTSHAVVGRFAADDRGVSQTRLPDRARWANPRSEVDDQGREWGTREQVLETWRSGETAGSGLESATSRCGKPAPNGEGGPGQGTTVECCWPGA
jgi:hypothetical protein